MLGDLIGLGGAKFRLPLLIKTFGFAALDAVILNEFISLVVVASALPFCAGSLTLAIRLPTMLTSFGRYSLDRSFSVLGQNRNFMLLMAAGSLLGACLGGQLLDIVPESMLLPFLSLILLISAIKVWRHQ